MRHRFVIGWFLAAAACLVLSADASPPAQQTEHPDGRLMTVTIEARFETEEVNIPGWEGGPFSEPVGEGTVELRLVFPSNGGEPVMQSGSAELDLYGCRGSAPCRCSIPVHVIDRVWEPVIFQRVSWDRGAGVLEVMGPVDYPDDETPVTIQCSGAPSTTVPDYPLFKLLGAFTEANEGRRGSAFAVPVSAEGAGHRVFEHELYSRGPKVFRARIEITTAPGPPETAG